MEVSRSSVLRVVVDARIETRLRAIAGPEQFLWDSRAVRCGPAMFSERCVIANEDFVTNHDVTITAVAAIATSAVGSTIVLDGKICVTRGTNEHCDESRMYLR